MLLSGGRADFTLRMCRRPKVCSPELPGNPRGGRISRNWSETKVVVTEACVCGKGQSWSLSPPILTFMTTTHAKGMPSSHPNLLWHGPSLSKPAGFATSARGSLPVIRRPVWNSTCGIQATNRHKSRFVDLDFFRSVRIVGCENRFGLVSFIIDLDLSGAELLASFTGPELAALIEASWPRNQTPSPPG